MIVLVGFHPPLSTLFGDELDYGWPLPSVLTANQTMIVVALERVASIVTFV